MKVTALLATAIFYGLAKADYVLHERRFAEHGVKRGERVNRTSLIDFRIGLIQSNLEQGYDYLLDVSHPTSSNYGKHWTSEQVRLTFRPLDETIDAVEQWLTTNGIERGSEERGYLSIQMPAAKAEQLFRAQYFEFEDVKAGDIRIGCDEYHLPEDIAAHVDFIVPGIALSPPLEKHVLTERSTSTNSMRAHVSRLVASRQPEALSTVLPASDAAQKLPPELQHCGFRISPECLKALYSLPSANEVASSDNHDPVNSLGIFEFDGTYDPHDMNLFFKRFASYISHGTKPIPAPINNATIKQVFQQPYTNVETELDLQIIYPIIYPQTVTLYQLSAKHQYLDNFLNFPLAIQDFLDAIDSSFCDFKPPNEGHDCEIYKPKRVISLSYGAPEILYPQKYTERLCNEFMKLGLQGTTFVVSSGDYGVAAQPGLREPGNVISNGCIEPGNFNETVSGYKPHKPMGVNGTVFSPQFPATCSYVLSVGATRLYPGQTLNDAESAMQIPRYLGEKLAKENIEFGSSGGFSNYFSRPNYQQKVVDTYFRRNNPPYPSYSLDLKNVEFKDIGANGGIYNRNGRAFPDVSSNGANIYVVEYGKTTTGFGTSAAAPTWASIFTLINEKRTSAGKGPAGFVNPVLYEHPEVFNDIVNGTNPGCFTKGFAAVPGWDPITGLGTPNYPKLLKLFMSLP